jgi:N-methylhydantoinase B
LALAKEVGWDALDDYARQWFDYSESRMAEALRKIPSGQVTRTSTHDAFPGTPAEGIPVKVTVTVKSEDALIEVDLRDNLDSLPCGLNLSEACARTAAMVGIFNSIDHAVPKNAGAFRRIKLHLREGCVVGIPRHPTSCSVATTNVADRVANATQAAIAELKDGVGMAECGAVIPPAAGVISGVDPRSGKRFVNQVFLGFTGGAAAPTTDAWLTIGHVGNAGLVFQDSIEIDEIHHPIYVHARALLPDTEGAGRTRGAPSALSEFGPVDCAMAIGYVSDGTINAATGTRGGLNGAPANQYRRTVDGGQAPLPACAMVTLEPGERIVSISAAGGGYGPPHEREPLAVAKDVRSGWVTPERARTVYGVALRADGAVDEAATAVLRRGRGK